MDTYSWTGPNGFTSSLQNPTIPNASLIHAGFYNLEVTLNGCSSDPEIGITFVDVETCPRAYSWGDTCMDHDLEGDPEHFLLGSAIPDQDLYAVGFYNPKGVAKLTSVSFMFGH